VVDGSVHECVREGLDAHRVIMLWPGFQEKDDTEGL
jgi:hypothetical protein